MNDSPFLLAMVARSYVRSRAENGAAAVPRRQREDRRLAWRATTAGVLHRLADRLEPAGCRPAPAR